MHSEECDAAQTRQLFHHRSYQKPSKESSTYVTKGAFHSIEKIHVWISGNLQRRTGVKQPFFQWRTSLQGTFKISLNREIFRPEFSVDWFAFRKFQKRPQAIFVPFTPVDWIESFIAALLIGGRLFHWNKNSTSRKLLLVNGPKKISSDSILPPEISERLVINEPHFRNSVDGFWTLWKRFSTIRKRIRNFWSKEIERNLVKLLLSKPLFNAQ